EFRRVLFRSLGLPARRPEGRGEVAMGREGSYGRPAPGRNSAVQKALNTASDQCPRERSMVASAAGGENAARYGRVVVRASYTSTMPTICADTGISSPRRRSG